MNNIDLIRQIQTILQSCCDNPSDQLIKEGEALVAIGRAMHGLSPAEARAAISAAALLLDVQPQEVAA